MISKKRIIILAAAASAVAVVIALLSERPVSVEKRKLAEAPTPWRQPRHPFDPKRCLNGKCKKLLRLPPVANEDVSIMVDPEIDDGVAQWSDCIGSIAQCVDRKREVTVQGFQACVGQSKCPESCKEGFARKTREVQDVNGMMTEFTAYFVDEGGACVPR